MTHKPVTHFLSRAVTLAYVTGISIAQSATCTIDRSSWPPADEVIATAAARLCAGNLSVALVHTNRQDLGEEGYAIDRQGERWLVSANSSRGSLWGAYALADALDRGATPHQGASKPYFAVREWWSAAFQANFNLPLGGAFDRPIEEISAIVERTIREAPKYGINTLQLMGRAGEGGIDISWFLEYDRFPKLRARRLGHGLAWRIEEIRRLAREAHRHGLDFLLWDHELVFPPALLEAHPEIRGVDYPVCFSHPFIREFVAAKFDEFFTRMPEVDGINLTFAETRGYNILEHGGCRCDLCRRTSTADKVRQVALDVYQVCRKHGKRMEVRSYNQQPAHAAVMEKALKDLPKDIVVVTKNTVVDFRGTGYPDNPMLGSFPGQPEAIELSACPEGSGYGYIPALLGDFYKEKLGLAKTRRLAGAAIRTDYNLQYGHATFFNPGPPVLTFDTPNEFNVYAGSRLAWDPSLNMENLWMAWAQRRYGRQDAPRAIRALKRTAEIAEGIFFVKGFSLLTHLNQVPHLETIDAELEKSYLLEYFPDNESYRRTYQLLSSPRESTIAQVMAEKERALDQARESLRDGAGIAEIERGLRVSANGAALWKHIAAVYFRLRSRPFDRARFDSAVHSLADEARRIESEQGRSWPVYPAARGVTVADFIREARDRAARIEP